MNEKILNRIIRESVNNVLKEGQGWNFFKTHAKNGFDSELPSWDDVKEIPKWIKDGGKDDYFGNYYDDEGMPTRKLTATKKGKLQKIKDTPRAKIGRAAGLGGTLAATAARKGVEKMGNMFKGKSKPYESFERRLDNIITEAINGAVADNNSPINKLYNNVQQIVNFGQKLGNMMQQGQGQQQSRSAQQWNQMVQQLVNTSEKVVQYQTQIEKEMMQNPQNMQKGMNTNQQQPMQNNQQNQQGLMK